MKKSQHLKIDNVVYLSEDDLQIVIEIVLHCLTFSCLTFLQSDVILGYCIFILGGNPLIKPTVAPSSKQSKRKYAGEKRCKNDVIISFNS